VQDADVPTWWAGLGLPGLADIHVHFLPANIQRAVWAQFDTAGPKIGRSWPITYRDPVEQRIQILRSLGVRWFTALPYAHRPGVAAYLNDWATELARATPDCLHSATFYPEPGATDDVRARLDAGAQVFKVHVQVGEFDPGDPLLHDVWDLLEDSGTPVVIHAGSGPVPGEHTGPAPVERLLRRHPLLTLVMAHMGAPEYEPFLRLAQTYERVHLDTTMAFTDFFEVDAPFPRTLLPALAELRDKVLLGSDFPSIPYEYAHQLEALERLGLGPEWLRAVCWDNTVRLLGPGIRGAPGVL
jgi:predicted TIM-barrel fold metal-dependent hydrolase